MGSRSDSSRSTVTASCRIPSLNQGGALFEFPKARDQILDLEVLPELGQVVDDLQVDIGPQRLIPAQIGQVRVEHDRGVFAIAAVEPETTPRLDRLGFTRAAIPSAGMPRRASGSVDVTKRGETYPRPAGHKRFPFA